MTDTIFFLLSLSIIFAALLGVIRFRNMEPLYHPFIYYAWMVLLVEIVVYILISKKMYTQTGIILNLFALAEFYLLTLLFHNWGLFKRNKNIFIAIIAFFFLLYVSTLFLRGYTKRNLFSGIIDSFALIFFSITTFNKMILNERINIFKNAKFWICIGMVIYYTCVILVSTETITFSKAQISKDFSNSIWQINAYANLLVNLLYAVAVIWIPQKKNIMTPF